MTGKQRGIDLVFLLDQSNSMRFYDLNGNRLDNQIDDPNSRQSILRRFLNGDDNDGFLADFMDSNEDNNVAIAWFGGSDPMFKYYTKSASEFNGSQEKQGSSSTYEDYIMRYGISHAVNGVGEKDGHAGVAADWTDTYDGEKKDAVTKAKLDNAGLDAHKAGTDYMMGFWQTIRLMEKRDQLDQIKKDADTDFVPNRKIIVVLGDGAPTYYVGSTRVGTSVGDGTGTKWNEQSDAAAFGVAEIATYQQFKAELQNPGDPTSTALKNQDAPLWMYGAGMDSRPNPGDVKAVNNIGINVFMDRTKESVEDFKREIWNLHSDTKIYSIAYNLTKAEDIEFMNTLSPSREEGAFSVNSPEELEAALDTIINQFPENIEIFDELSDYVSLQNQDLSDATVTVIDETTGTKTVVWQDGKAVSGVNITVGGKDYSASEIIEDVGFKNGKVTAKFDENFRLGFDHRVVLSFNVKVEDEAYKRMSNNVYSGGEYDLGSDNTDTDDILTSSNRIGFFSNNNAHVTYDVKNKDGKGAIHGDQLYEKPVIQVIQKKVHKITTDGITTGLDSTTARTGALDKLELESKKDKFAYTIAAGANQNTTSLAFYDELENVLELVENDKSVKVYAYTNGSTDVTDITDRFTPGNSESKIELKWADPDGGLVSGASTIIMTFEAKIKDDADLSQYEGDGGWVPNTATVDIDRGRHLSKTVYVKPPTPDDEKPVKKVNGKDKETLAAINTPFTYTVEATVPSDATKIEISDTIKNVLDFADKDSATLTDENGQPVAGATFSGTGKTIIATVDGITAESGLRGKKVTLTFDAYICVDDDALVAEYIDRTVPNTATLKINDDPARKHETDVVTVKPPTPDDEKPVKKVNGKDKETLAAINTPFTYTVEATVPSDATKIEISDTIKNVLDFADKDSATLTDENGQPVAGATFSGTGKTIIATVDGITAESGLRGKKVTLTFDAYICVDDDALVAEYIDRTVPNTATLKINDDPARKHETDVVTVKPPTPNPEKPEIKKYVDTSKTDGFIDTHGDLGSLDETYNYQIVTKIPANAKGFVVSDKLDKVLTIRGAVSVSVGGNDVTGADSYDSATKTLNVTFAEEFVKANAGKEVTIGFSAKIGVSSEDLVKVYADRTVPNKASYTITNLKGEDLKPEGSNTVTVKPPVPVGSVVVRYVDTDGKNIIPATDGEYDPVITDEKEGTKYATTLKEIPGYIFVKVNTPDDEYDFTGDDDPEGEVVAGKTTKVTYIYEKVEEPEKRVNGSEKPVSLKERNETFTYTISQKIPLGATKVTFTDTLEDALEILGYGHDGNAYYKTDIDGQTITISTENATADRGQVVTFTVQAAIKESYTDDMLIEKYGTAKRIPNVATVTINGQSKITNEVEVTPPDSGEQHKPDTDTKRKSESSDDKKDAVDNKNTDRQSRGRKIYYKASSSKVSSPATGDTDPTPAFVVLAAAAVAGMVTVVAVRRRKKY